MFGHELAEAEVAVRFDAVGNDGLRFGEGLLHFAQVVKQCGLAVDVERRAVLLGEFGHGHVFAEQGAVAVFEVIHGGDLETVRGVTLSMAAVMTRSSCHTLCVVDGNPCTRSMGGQLS